MEICTFFDNAYELYTLKRVATPDDAFEDARRLGVASVDIGTSIFRDICPSEAYSLLCRHNLKTASVHTVFKFDYLDPGSMEDAFETVKEAFHQAEEVHSPYLMIVPLTAADVPGYSMDECKKAMILLLQKAVDYSKQTSVTPTIENFSRSDFPYSTISDVMDILKAVPGLKFTFDSANFFFVNNSILHALDVFKDYTVHVHIKDSIFSSDNPLVCRYGAGFEGVAIGDGFLDCEHLIKKLQSINYTGALTIEIFSNYPVYDKYAKSVKFIRSVLSA